MIAISGLKMPFLESKIRFFNFLRKKLIIIFFFCILPELQICHKKIKKIETHTIGGVSLANGAKIRILGTPLEKIEGIKKVGFFRIW